VGLSSLIVFLSHQHSDVMFDGDRRQGFDFSSKPVRAFLAQRPHSDPLSAIEAYDRAGDAARPPWKEQHQRLQPKAQAVHERKGVDDGCDEFPFRRNTISACVFRKLNQCSTELAAAEFTGYRMQATLSGLPSSSFRGT
jgi:hypothetical protein